jgi:hypothetical protein
LRGHIFVIILPSATISMAMNEPKNGARVFFKPYYEKMMTRLPFFFEPFIRSIINLITLLIEEIRIFH